MAANGFGRTPLLLAGTAAVGLIALGGAGLAFASGLGADAPAEARGDGQHVEAASSTPDIEPARSAGGESSGPAEPAGGSEETILDLARVLNLAEEAVPDGVVHDVERGGAGWEIDVVVLDEEREYELRVDRSGAVSTEREGRADDEDMRAAQAGVGLVEAAQAAERELGGTVTSVQFEAAERDDDDDDAEERIARWEVEVDDDREIGVSAEDGAILHTDD
ncbi:hypothetical protein ACQEU5_07500 [Marinactinospora thermotolerans]|uniref:hypothetical protein n=1 Tax=Marinactinospora thermotolerans TaxID=531310 RepID=UPI003D90AC15